MPEVFHNTLLKVKGKFERGTVEVTQYNYDTDIPKQKRWGEITIIDEVGEKVTIILTKQVQTKIGEMLSEKIIRRRNYLKNDKM